MNRMNIEDKLNCSLCLICGNSLNSLRQYKSHFAENEAIDMNFWGVWAHWRISIWINKYICQNLIGKADFLEVRQAKFWICMKPFSVESKSKISIGKLIHFLGVRISIFFFIPTVRLGLDNMQSNHWESIHENYDKLNKRRAAHVKLWKTSDRPENESGASGKRKLWHYKIDLFVSGFSLFAVISPQHWCCSAFVCTQCTFHVCISCFDIYK